MGNLLQGFLPQSKETTATAAPVCVVGTTLYFEAYDATTNSDGLWRSDGTASGTVLVKSIVSRYGAHSFSNLTAVGNTLFFSAYDANNGQELWKSDGTTSGTVLVKDIVAGAGDSYPGNLTAAGNTLFFSSRETTNGEELWKSDGTTAGTGLVKDIVAGNGDSAPGNLTAVGNTLFFSSRDTTNGEELWKSDGTTAGTVLVKDVFAGPSGSGPSNLTAVANTLYFIADDGISGTGLWKSDGTVSGTSSVKNVRPSFLAAVGESLFYGISNSENADGLWKIDGHAGGAFLVKDVKRIDPNSVTTVGSTLFFITSGESGGAELWKSDGTKDGTVLVKPFTFPSYLTPTRLIAAGNALFFQADVLYDINNKSHELWKSDGTEAGTTVVNDLTPNSIGDAPFLLTFAALMQIHFGVITDRNYQKYLSELPPPLQRTLSYLINPEIGNIPDQTVTSGFSTTALPFTVWPGGGDFPVSASSSDQTLVRDADIILGGSGGDRTVTVKSAANVSGTATITLTVSNGNSTTNIATESFALTINPGQPQNFSVSFTPKGKPVADGKATRQFGSVKRTQKAGVIRNLTLTNTGTAPLTGLKILKDGDAASDFIVKGLNKKPLAPRKSITFDVIFRPKSAGSKLAFLHISSSESLENPFDLTLAGTGVRAKKQR